ncbi:sigma factor-like helix-turn-helix DNA-binding protein [Clostridium sp.]|uniref:sigma factor-like helix-turn-helix DNA-binding protein n=1 Tax=Clostridium sp. TaxID=1506 RepID=UPI002909C756|nr:sigma factor-like helix-turn-helix DNA-binding protein [Clostridium sp.]MDU3411728.1 sigma factor-like helix-turn-helix DNA-binding protein [Clostridium sp.]
MRFENMTPYELGESKCKEAIPYLLMYLKRGNLGQKKIAACAIRKLVPLYKMECMICKDSLYENLKIENVQLRLYMLKTIKELHLISLEDQVFLFRILKNEEDRKNQFLIRNLIWPRKGKEINRISELEKIQFDSIYNNEICKYRIPTQRILSILNNEDYIRDLEISNLLNLNDIFEEVVNDFISFYLKKERVIKIIKQRFLGYTLRQIGDEFGVSHERIRQLQEKGIRRLRGAYKNNNSEFRHFIEQIFFYDKDEYLNLCAFYDIFLNSEKRNYSSSIFKIILNDEESKKVHERKMEYYKLFNENKIKNRVKENAIKKFDTKVLNKVNWPNKCTLVNNEMVELLRPKRSINDKGEGNSGSYYSNKCKCMINYESLLELKIYMLMENCEKVKYYREQAIEVPYYRNVTGKYYPDFICILEDRKIFIGEIKPISNMLSSDNMCKYIALKEFCQSRGFGYIMLDTRFSYDEFLLFIDSIESNQKFEKEIFKQLKELGEINIEDYRKVRNEYNVSYYQLYKAIKKYHLNYTQFPFRLSIL